ncbi:MAG TPA: MFS transporter [Pseudonocardiaceae bacterium]|nr:MFS transporter [Pseudonocardiaceae bacterium]
MPLETRLDRSAWRPMHSRILLALGIGWALDSFEVQIIGSVLTPLAKDFGVLGADGAISPGAVSLIWVVWFAGLMTGATAFGWLADRFGRKRLFVATLVMYSIATVVSAFSPTFLTFLIFRFVTAMGVGGEYSAVTSAIAEFMPTRRRGAATAATMNFWSVGGILAGLIGIFFLNNFVANQLALGGVTLSAWRLCLLAGAAAAIYGLIARRTIPESPRWLASQGCHAEASVIVTEITGIADDGTDLAGTPKRRSLASQIGELWVNWRARLVYGMVLEFSGSAAYYGLFTFVSAYVLISTQVDVSPATVPLFYLVGNIGALVGGFTVAALIDRIGRTAVTRLSYGTASISVLLLALAALAKSPAETLAAFTLCVFSATCSWISAYTTFSELFPTELRGTGIGVSVAAGRLGGMVGVVGLSYAVSGLGLVSAFVILAIFFAIGAIAALLWGSSGGVEARGLSLDAVAPVAATV